MWGQDMVPPTPLHHLCSLAASTIVAFSPLPFPIIHLFSTCWMDTDSSLAVSPSLPSLGASLYRILCMRRASAATSHVTEESVEADQGQRRRECFCWKKSAKSHLILSIPLLPGGHDSNHIV